MVSLDETEYNQCVTMTCENQGTGEIGPRTGYGFSSNRNYISLNYNDAS